MGLWDCGCDIVASVWLRARGRVRVVWVWVRVVSFTNWLRAQPRPKMNSAHFNPHRTLTVKRQFAYIHKNINYTAKLQLLKIMPVYEVKGLLASDDFTMTWNKTGYVKHWLTFLQYCTLYQQILEESRSIACLRGGGKFRRSGYKPLCLNGSAAYDNTPTTRWQRLRRRTCDLVVVGSIPGRAAFKLRTSTQPSIPPG